MAISGQQSAEPRRPDAALTQRLPDPIADARPSGKFLRVLAELRQLAQETERNV